MFTHCYGHALNIAAKDGCNVVKYLKDIFDTAREICKLVTKSAQRDTHLKQIWIERGNEDSNVHSFCPTPCTRHGQTFRSILDNDKELMELLKWCPKLYGQIWLLVWMPLGKTFVVSNRQSFKNNPKTWDVCSRSTIIGQELLKFSSVRLIWWKLSALLGKSSALQSWYFDVDDAQVSRKRKIPSRFQSGERESYHYHENPDDKYKQVYYEAFDRVIAYIKKRFEQKDYHVYAKMLEILLSVVRKQICSEDCLNCVHSFYGDNFCKARLKDQLRLLPTMATIMAITCQTWL